MKPASFRYFAAESLEHALELKAEHGDEAKFLAGGQSLIPAMNFRLAQPAMLIDLNRLKSLDYIRAEHDGRVRIGAMTRQRALERDMHISRHQPLLAEAMPNIAHPQIRNRGTLGGNLAHADPASELPAVLLALDGRVRARSARAERWIDARDFFITIFTTALQADEMLVEVELPALPARTGTAFMEVSRRHGDYAMMGVCVVVRLDDDGTCQHARLVFFNAGETAITATRAAESLIGQRITEAAARNAAQLAQTEINPSGNVHASEAFQRHLAAVLARRAILQAKERLKIED